MDCCLDTHFSKRYKAMAGSRQKVDSAQGLAFLRKVFAACPVNNVKVETQFSRQRRFKASCSGNMPDAATIASTHVLAEFASLHSKWMADKPLDKPCDATMKVPTEKRRKLCAWNVYVKQNRSDLNQGVSMATLSDRFSKLSEAEKKQHCPPLQDETSCSMVLAPCAPLASAPGAPVELDQTSPLKMGTRREPVASERIQECAANIRDFDARWKARAGRPHKEQCVIKQPSCGPRCQDLYGPCRSSCRRQFTDAGKHRFYEINNLLNKLAYDPVASPYCVQKYFLEVDCETGGEYVQCILLTKMAVYLNPVIVVFEVTELIGAMPPLPLDMAIGLERVALTELSVRTNMDVARMYAPLAKKVVLHKVDWEFDGCLHAFRVLSWRDATAEILRLHRPAPKAKSASLKLAARVGNLLRGPKEQKQGCSELKTFFEHLPVQYHATGIW